MRHWLNDPLIWLAGLVVLLIWLLFTVPSHGQTVCVQPITPMSIRPSVKKEIESWVVRKGFQAGCQNAKWDLVVEPIGGTVPFDNGYFVLQFAADSNSVVGTISTFESQYQFKSWMVFVFQSGTANLVAYGNGWNWKAGVAKVLRKAGRTRWK